MRWAAAAHPGQLVGPRILTVPSGLRAILRRDLAVEAALCAIVCRHLAIVDGSHAAVRRIGALGGGPGARIRRALAIGRRAIPRRSVEVAGRVVAGLGLPVAQPGRDVSVARCQAGLPAAHRPQLVGP